MEIATSSNRQAELYSISTVRNNESYYISKLLFHTDKFKVFPKSQFSKGRIVQNKMNKPNKTKAATNKMDI